MLATLSPRQEHVLGAVVEEFVNTAEPVGSRTLTRKCDLGVSPATIRNVMADLEELGYLNQPHTSAGRQPTDGGYRYYVDHLMPADAISSKDRRRLRKQVSAGTSEDLEEMLDLACKALSSVCHQVGIVVGPSFESRVFRHIDFVLFRPGRILVILVSASGVVDHRPVEAPEIASQAELDCMASYLDELLVGVPLRDVRDKIEAELAEESALYDSMRRRALQLGSRALLDGTHPDEVFFGDRVRLLEQPEFTDVVRMKGVFEAFEQKGTLLRLLDRAAATAPRHVLIGGESQVPDLETCSVVSSKYSREGHTVGTVGVIGPTRMDYPRVIGLVDYTARLIGEHLENL